MTERLQKMAQRMLVRGLTHMILAPGASFEYVTGKHIHKSERLTLLGMTQDGTMALIVPLLEEETYRDHDEWSIFTFQDEDGYEIARDNFVRFLNLTQSSKIGIEHDQLRLFEADALRGVAQGFTTADDLVMGLRLIKDETEINAIERAAGIVDQALQDMLPILKAGMAEVEVAAELEYRMRRLGSAGVPFSTIVCAGERAALPHGEPSDRRIREGELVVLDYGAMVHGYSADTTRTLSFGDPGQEAHHVYETVKKAQAMALSIIRSGITAQEVDRAARDIIEDAGFGPYFTHRTGHGLGLDVHEFPSIMRGNDLRLEPGMVFTVEPGIYVPSQLGVRIEDDVVVTSDGVRILTQFTKELIII